MDNRLTICRKWRNRWTIFLACSRRLTHVMLDLNIRRSSISEVTSARIRAIPLLEDIRDTLFHMSKGKAPGPDGGTVDVYAHQWNVIKHDLSAEISTFFTRRRMIKSLNHTLLILIPKKDASTCLEDYRPISCVDVPYKVIAKILAKRMLLVLPDMISRNQCVFLKGRHISDNIGLAHEFMLASTTNRHLAEHRFQLISERRPIQSVGMLSMSP